jgi:hypothetical protein
MSNNKWTSFSKKPISTGRAPLAVGVVKRAPQSRASVLQAQKGLEQIQIMRQQEQVILEQKAAMEQKALIEQRRESVADGYSSVVAPSSLPLRDSYNNDFEEIITINNRYASNSTNKPSLQSGASRSSTSTSSSQSRQSSTIIANNDKPSLSIRKSETQKDNSVKTILISPTKKIRNSSSNVKSVNENHINKLMGHQSQSPTPKSRESHRSSAAAKKQKNFNGWTKTEPSKQDEISQDAKEFGSRFQGYIEIPPEAYATIQPDTWIRYMKYNPDSKFGYDYRSGGKVVRNKFPDFWALKPTHGNGKQWCVPLKGKNRYFRKDMTEMKNANTRNAKLYDAVKAGTYMLLSKDEYLEYENLRKKLNGEK